MTNKMKPMLASVVDWSKVEYPLIVQPKLDGVACVVKDGEVLGRSLKPIPNEHVQNMFSSLEGVHGELVVGSPTDDQAFQNTSGAVRRGDGKPDVKLYVFDLHNRPEGYTERYERMKWIVKNSKSVVVVESHLCHSKEEVEDLSAKFVEQGYEGAMLRKPDGKYKYGRSTAKEQLLLKLKPLVDGEFEIIGFTEMMKNGNEAKVNELGYAERSSHKAHLIPTGMMGTLILKWYGDDTFECGTGFTHEQRKEIWDNQGEWLGKVAKVRYQAIGMKEGGKPRIPSFKGLREKFDMSEG